MRTLYTHAAMSAKIVAEAFYNGELENEIRLLVEENNTLKLADFVYMKDSDRDVLMENIEAIRSSTIYRHHHHQRTQECKHRGDNPGPVTCSVLVCMMHY